MLAGLTWIEIKCQHEKPSRRYLDKKSRVFLYSIFIFFFWLWKWRLQESWGFYYRQGDNYRTLVTQIRKDLTGSWFQYNARGSAGSWWSFMFGTIWPHSQYKEVLQEQKLVLMQWNESHGGCTFEKGRLQPLKKRGWFCFLNNTSNKSILINYPTVCNYLLLIE